MHMMSFRGSAFSFIGVFMLSCYFLATMFIDFINEYFKTTHSKTFFPFLHFSMLLFSRYGFIGIGIPPFTSSFPLSPTHHSPPYYCSSIFLQQQSQAQHSAVEAYHDIACIGNGGKHIIILSILSRYI